jgi:hypothetical protein
MPRLDTAQRMNMRTFRATIVLLHEAEHATCMKHTTCDEHVACIDVPMESPIGYAAAYRSLLVVWTTAEHCVADGRLFAIVCSALLCSALLCSAAYGESDGRALHVCKGDAMGH